MKNLIRDFENSPQNLKLKEIEESFVEICEYFEVEMEFPEEDITNSSQLLVFNLRKQIQEINCIIRNKWEQDKIYNF